jgi:RHS repeat-associated protein
VYTWSGSSYSLQSTTRFLYDGWNLLTELDGSNTLLRSYMWGLDLSGSMQGAGGVGGLLAMRPNGGAAHFAAYDGNGNLTALVDGSAGTVSANYEYSPFGETIRITGAQATPNKCRFSTKYTDDESDFLYYGYRLLNASTGRWLSRDLIEERGGMNLCAFARNSPICLFDINGNGPVPGDRMTPPEFFALSTPDKIGWAKAFGARFAALIEKAAKENCIPKRLVAIIIANEMIDWRWPDGTPFDGARGGGVGPAQISPTTAVNENVTGMNTSDFKPYLQWSTAGPTSVDTSFEISPYAQHVSAASKLLQSDNGAVDVAARLLQKYVSEMCGKTLAGQPVFGPGAQARFYSLDQKTLRDFCNKCKDCDAIVNAPLPPGLADAFAAKCLECE